MLTEELERHSHDSQTERWPGLPEYPVGEVSAHLMKKVQHLLGVPKAL